MPTPAEIQIVCDRMKCLFPNNRIYFGRKTFQNRIISVDLEDLLTVGSGWLVDSAVEWVLAAEITSANQTNDVYLLEPYAASEIFDCRRMNDEIKDDKEAQFLKTEYRKISQCLMQSILIPYCNGIHYYLIVINFTEKSFYCWDSKRNSSSPGAKDFFNILKKIAILDNDSARWQSTPEKEWTVADVTCSQQTDGESCGIFLIEFSKKILKNQKCFEVELNPVVWRRQVFKQLYLQCKVDNSGCIMCGGFDDTVFDVVCKGCPIKMCSECSKGVCPNCRME